MPPATLHARVRDFRWVAESLVVASIYFVTARLGLLLAMPGGHVTSVWPPSGLALAALILLGRRVWPGIWLGSFTVNFWDFYGSPMSLATELGTAATLGFGGSLAALAGAHLLQRCQVGKNPLARLRDVGVFLGLGGMVSCLISATLGASALSVAGYVPWAKFGEIWLTWWTGDTAGVFVAAPLFLVWSGVTWAKSASRAFELVACFAVLVSVTYFVFIANTTARPLAFILIPVLVWPALRFGQRGAVVAVGLVALLAIWGTIHQAGPFRIGLRNDSLLLLELFLTMVVLTALCMAAMVTERNQAQAAQQRTLAELEIRVRDRTAALEKLLEEKRATEILLRENERSVRDILDNLAAFVALVSLDGGILEINRAPLEAAGVRREDVIGKDLGDTYWCSDLPEVQAQLRAVIRRAAAGEIVAGDFRLRMAQGVMMDVFAVFAPLRDASGAIVKVIGSGFDITQRKQAEAALRESEEKFRAYIEQAADALFVHDFSGRLVDVNQQACRSLGYDREALLRLGVADFEAEFDLARAQAFWSELRPGETQTFEGMHRRRDGTRFPVEIRIGCFDRQGERRFLVLIRDSTERKQAEAERQSLEVQLRQSQKLEAIGTLAGGIAHDFNNILAGIVGFTSLARTAARGNPELLDYLREVSQAGSRATELVQQILAFSRVSGDQAMVPVQWRQIVAESIKLLRAAIPSTIEIETELPAVLPAVLGNGTQLHQMMMNLGTNAAQAMRGRAGRLRVSLEACLVDATYARTLPGLAPGPCVRLAIADTGCGMEAKTRERIFEPFFTTKGPGEGTGLGLAVVHGIVRSHRGAIHLTSAVEQGTTFEIFLPAIAANLSPEIEKSEEMPRGHGERILIVDDEPMLVKAHGLALRNLGYATEGEVQVHQALTRLRHDPQSFHLVITDQTMPGMTGLEFAARVQALRPDLPVILVSGFSRAITQEKIQAAGVREMLAKPFTLAELAAALRRQLPPPLPEST